MSIDINIASRLSKKYCKAPWMGYHVSQMANGIYPCCYYDPETPVEQVQNLPPEKLLGAWNDKAMQNARKFLASDQGSQNPPWPPCSQCQYYLPDSLDYFTALGISDLIVGDYETLSDLQKENLELFYKDFQAGSLICESTPLAIVLHMGFTCNIKCPKCHQLNPYFKNLGEKSSDMPIETAIKLLPFIEKAISVNLIGGDPFVIKSSVKLLELLVNDPKYHSVRIILGTNALLLDKYFDLIKKHPKITIITSPDSLDYTYDLMHGGKSWDKFNKNLKEFQRIGKENNFHWNIMTHNMLMTSTIDRIDEFAKWSVENDFVATFSPFWNWERSQWSDKEDIGNIERIEQVWNWEIKMQRAIDIFEKANFRTSAETLRTYKDEYTSKLKAVTLARLNKESKTFTMRIVEEWRRFKKRRLAKKK